MNPTTNNVLQEYKQCARRNCQRVGVHYLKVLYLDVKGWFCNARKDSLASEGLVVQDDNDTLEASS